MVRREPDRRKTRAGPRSRPPAGGRIGASVRGSRRVHNFVLYVEGPRDRELLECWARRLDGELARCIEAHTVILGGRQPARAVADFRKRGGAEAGLAGLIVLDRDHHDEPPEAPVETGLDLFVWSLRHIESYVLVPAAIRRLLCLEADDQRVERFVADHARDGAHAKRILGARGLLAELLGVELRAGEIARAMRSEDLHGDIHDLFREIGSRAGIAPSRGAGGGVEVVVRAPARATRAEDPVES